MEKPFMKGDSFEIQLSIITRAEMGNETETQVGNFSFWVKILKYMILVSLFRKKIRKKVDFWNETMKTCFSAHLWARVPTLPMTTSLIVKYPEETLKPKFSRVDKTIVWVPFSEAFSNMRTPLRTTIDL